jgi:hypothetical protein
MLLTLPVWAGRGIGETYEISGRFDPDEVRSSPVPRPWTLRMARAIVNRKVRWMAPQADEERALEAIRWAAKRLDTPPEELRVTSYRSVQLRRRRGAMPPESAIREAFGSWIRARERAGISRRRGL